MSTLCVTCQSKTPMAFIGHCVKCSQPTTSFNFQLCDNCSQQLQECKWCRNPLSSTSSYSYTTTPANTKFIVVDEQTYPTGSTVKGVNVGEQVHVRLVEDRWSGKQWGFLRSGWGIQMVGSPTIKPDPHNNQYQWREFVFDVTKSGITADIEFHEVSGYGWSWSYSVTPVVNGKKYKVTIKVK